MLTWFSSNHRKLSPSSSTPNTVLSFAKTGNFSVIMSRSNSQMLKNSDEVRSMGLPLKNSFVVRSSARILKYSDVVRLRFLI